MQAPVESAHGGSKTAFVEPTEPLQQPKDAVAMEKLPQTFSEQVSSSLPTESQPSSSAAAPASEQSEPTTHDVTPPSSKGKEKEEKESAPPLSPVDRQDSMAIGAAVDDIQAVVPSGPDAGPVCNITLLLTAGTRHPYKIDAKYLSRRNVAVPEQTENGQPDPFSISIYTLKELILREWRNDWEAKPASPSSIRLIHFGKLLDDKEQLKKYQFSTESPNVVHMSIRPQDLDDEEPRTGNKNLSSGGGDGQRQRSGGCCVIL